VLNGKLCPGLRGLPVVRRHDLLIAIPYRRWHNNVELELPLPNQSSKLNGRRGPRNFDYGQGRQHSALRSRTSGRLASELGWLSVWSGPTEKDTSCSFGSSCAMAAGSALANNAGNTLLRRLFRSNMCWPFTRSLPLYLAFLFAAVATARNSLLTCCNSSLALLRVAFHVPFVGLRAATIF
jgi:hypothetical protein